MKKVLISLTAAMLLAGAPAYAAGGGSGGMATQSSPAAKELETAQAMIKRGDYAAAVKVLQIAITKDPGLADAWNWHGYASRKNGDLETAATSYGKALQLDPGHKGALEYQGELFLQTGQLAKAEENLGKLDKLCFFGCEEYTDLKEAIATYKAKQNS